SSPSSSKRSHGIGELFISSYNVHYLLINLVLVLVFLLLGFKVFDLGENAPDKVLHSIYAKLENLTVQGDQFAMKIMERLKLI
ncbi:hypothetical protein S83_012262, partial [Arachis hypogaea]